jgi:tripartite-type tricarboxylate transporter receptor subunit TctC
LILLRQETGRPVAAPPGVPEDRLAALRRAFDATMKDPEFLAEAEKTKLTVGPLPGEELQKLVADLYATPPHLIERARQALTAKSPSAKP